VKPRISTVAVTTLLGVLLWIAAKPQTLPLPKSPAAPETEKESPRRHPLRPWKAPQGELVGAFVANGPSHAGKEVVADIPSPLRAKNVGGRDGAGLCVFTSIMHSARYQNEQRLWDFQKQMQKEPGGGYPEKVDKMIEKYGKGTPYVQHTGGDPSFLRLALKTGRMPGVTYSGRDSRYNGPIAHMVNLVYLDDTDACILDNNFIGEYYWMSAQEFLQRWKSTGGGWAIVLLSNPPPPIPHN
jgi:hypothetical protein